MDPLEEDSIAAFVVKSMMKEDRFSQWMGMEVLHISEGKCTLRMCVHSTMLNGFHIAHGGISYSLADSCLAFAANSDGIKSVSIETSISHLLPVKESDVLIAVSEEINKTKRTAVYQVRVFNERENTLVALFKGVVHRTSQSWVNE
jgi:acyl-CoA thioesterase